MLPLQGMQGNPCQDGEQNLGAGMVWEVLVEVWELPQVQCWDEGMEQVQSVCLPLF